VWGGGVAGVHMLVPLQFLNQIHNFNEFWYERYAIGLMCDHFPRMDLIVLIMDFMLLHTDGYCQKKGLMQLHPNLRGKLI
jgi:hypothetical protein